MNTPKRKPSHQTKPAKGKTQVRAETADGQPLRFTQSLIAYIANRSEAQWRRGFRLGDWLATLDGDTLAHLVELSGQAAAGQELPPPAGEDLLSVAVHALSAEKAVRRVKYSQSLQQGWLVAICAAATLEGFRRDGLVEYDGRASMETEDVGLDIVFTEKGREFAAQAGIGAWSH